MPNHLNLPNKRNFEKYDLHLGILAEEEESIAGIFAPPNTKEWKKYTFFERIDKNNFNLLNIGE